MKESLIKKLEEKGFKRWQRETKADRLYISPTLVGLEVERYKTGNIKGAKVNGEEVTNAEGRRLYSSKIYIDVDDESVNISYGEGYFQKNVETLLEEAKKEAGNEPDPKNNILVFCLTMMYANDTGNKVEISFSNRPDRKTFNRMEDALDMLHKLKEACAEHGGYDPGEVTITVTNEERGTKFEHKCNSINEF